MSIPMETITAETELERAGFRWREGEAGVRAIACAPLEDEGFANAFSTRPGGVSPFPAEALNLAGFDQDSAENIRENRRRFIHALGGDWTLAACWQVHGRDVRVVRDLEDPDSERERCDALATDLRGVLLGVKTADCVPVILGDARTGACAAVHAGWRGTLAGIVRHALVDLHEANRRQLIESGVAAERIHALPLCTMCRPDLFFSYRQDRKLYGRTGRLLSVIGRRA